jgi:hypothetical protein
MGVRVRSLRVSQGSSSLSTCTTESRTNRLWLASKCVTALLTAVKRTSLALEFVHGDRWEGGSIVVLSLVLVYLVNWDGGVYDRRLDSLLLNNRLNVLMNVVVDMFSGESLTS